MRRIFGKRTRTRRLLVVFIALVCCVGLLSIDAVHYFPQSLADQLSAPWFKWLSFGYSAFVALTFLAVGALVWLYARSRWIATLLFGFSLATMTAFTVETNGALRNSDHFLTSVGLGAGAVSLLLFSALLLVFPQDFLAFSKQVTLSKTEKDLSKRPRQHYLTLGLRRYLIALACLCMNSVFLATFYYSLPLQLFNGLYVIDSVYKLIALVGILVTIIFSYFSSASIRERQQRRLFVIGVILTAAPLLLLTFIPGRISPLSPYAVSSQLTAIPIVLFPLTLGYTILRYQVLVFDMYIRRAVVWMVGTVGLTFLGYIVVTLSSILLAKSISIYVVLVVIAMAVCAPFIWWLAKTATERLFFSEILHYRKLIDSNDIMSSETFDLNEAAHYLTLAAVTTFETQDVCVFVLDDDTGCYRLYPPLKEGDPSEHARRHLAQLVLQEAKTPSHEGFDWVDANAAYLKHLDTAHRPLLLSEAMRDGGEASLGLGRYLAGISPVESDDPLLAAIQAKGKMIGVLVLGERGDHQSYAGPDFEAMFHMLNRFSPVLETARLYMRASQHVAILNTLYSANTMPVKDFETIEDVAVANTKIVAEATTAGAEIWLYNEQEGVLQFVAHEGAGPRLVHQSQIKPSPESDWKPWFYQGDREDGEQAWQGASEEVPACLDQTPCFPFAWMPLSLAKQTLGLLILTYSRPHHFSHEEKRVLQMFASQCVVALENARITIELRAAYERQKELDRLKDQFIITASHELRTPLTAVLGYIELLETYNDSLPIETRADFIAKAHYGCDELALMVNNIMDASRVHVDVDNIKLDQISLNESVQHVLEIIEIMISREERAVHVDMPANVCVMADAMRLRQILLNLVGNALKYSPAGSPIEITCEVDDVYVTTHVRDYGLGVPLDAQVHLFERFVRLERDMNSPVRGAGLGLYISKQLVAAMGGRIWVESTGIPDEGSSFTFTLQRSMLGSEMDDYAFEHQEA